MVAAAAVAAALPAARAPLSAGARAASLAGTRASGARASALGRVATPGGAFPGHGGACAAGAAPRATGARRLVSTRVAAPQTPTVTVVAESEAAQDGVAPTSEPAAIAAAAAPVAAAEEAPPPAMFIEEADDEAKPALAAAAPPAPVSAAAPADGAPVDLGHAVTEMRLEFITGFEMRPRADKVAKGGEDACFVSATAMGVADGVGGWNESGVDPGEYAKALMARAASAAAAADETVSPQALLSTAWEGVKLPGACTAVVARLNAPARMLRVANLGDSGLRVYRGGELLFATPQQQHYFDCPYQLSDPGQVEVTDTPEKADTFDVAIRPGDVVLLGSDGVFDNCDPAELRAAMAACARACGGEPARLQKVAREAAVAIAVIAQKHSLDMSYASPYIKEAIAQGKDLPWWEKVQGKQLTGGKPDDITAVVGFVVERKEGEDAVVSTA